MDYKFVSKTENFNNNDFKSDLKLIEKSETFIWELHKSNRIIDLFDAIKKRTNNIKKLILIYISSNKRFDKIVDEIVAKFPEVESVNFKSHFEKITILVKNLEELVLTQVKELNVSDNLIDTFRRTSVLNGNKKLDIESEFTTTIKQIINLIDDNNIKVETDVSEFESGPIVNNEEIVISNSEKVIEIVADDVIEEKIEVINDTDELCNLVTSSVSITVNADNCTESGIVDSSQFNDFFEDSEVLDELIDTVEEVKKVKLEEVEIIGESELLKQNSDDELSNEKELFEIKPDESIIVEDKVENLEPSLDELIDIIQKYFCYIDSPEIEEVEKSRILKNAIASKSALRYAKILWDFKKEGKFEEVEVTSQKIYGDTLTDLYNYDIGISPYSLSKSWAIWDVAKQLFYIKNPSQTNKTRYKIANPLVDEEKQIEILDRHIGWEIYSKLTTGELDTFLSRFKNPIYRKRMVEFMIEKPNVTNTLSSYKLAELGKNVRLGFEHMDTE